jgi:PhzF family phenazine biosynthesis protein
MAMTRPRLYHVDAFADRPFSGNPAAVCLLSEGQDEQWMQSVAAEMNLSETAFVLPDGPAFQLRWFTPKVEVALCGHATLASAHVLWETGRLGSESAAQFHTKSGLRSCTRTGAEIEMDFPARPASPADAPEGLTSALDATPQFVGRSAYDYLLELGSPAAVRALAPDFARLSQLPVRGVIVTSRSDLAGIDFISRFFAPAAGVNEDPVTGSAHCTLGPYWSARLGREELVGRQVSSRGGVVKVRVAGERVFLRGAAVTVARGELA